MPSEPLEPNKIIAGAVGATAGTGLLAYLAQDPNFRRLSTDNMHNFLKGYYKRGAGVGTKAYLQAKELGKGSARAVVQGMNPQRSFTYGKTGLSDTILSLVDKNHTLIDVEKSKWLGGQQSWKKTNDKIKHLIKEVHFKATNDFSNPRLYGLKASKPLKDYVSREGSRAMAFVKNSSAAEAKRLGVSGKELQYMKSIWGADKTPNVGWQLYNKQNIQNPLRAIQFDKRVYRAFQELGTTLKSTGTINRNQFLRALQHENLLYSKKQLYNLAAYPTKMQYKALFRDLGKGKIAFNMNPAMKPIYDWGGFNGMVVWDEKNPRVVKLLASDMRDVMGDKILGKKKTIINYAAPQELRLEKFEQDLVKMKVELNKNLEEAMGEKKPRKTRKDKGVPRGPQKPETKGLDDFADKKGMKSIKGAQKKLISAEQAAVKNAAWKNNYFKKYFLRRWLPTRLGLLGGVGLAAAGTFLLWDHLHDRS